MKTYLKLSAYEVNHIRKLLVRSTQQATSRVLLARFDEALSPYGGIAPCPMELIGEDDEEDVED